MSHIASLRAIEFPLEFVGKFEKDGKYIVHGGVCSFCPRLRNLCESYDITCSLCACVLQVLLQLLSRLCLSCWFPKRIRFPFEVVQKHQA